MNLPPLRQIILLVGLLIVIIIGGLVLMQGRVSFTSNITDYRIDIDGKEIQVQSSKSLTLNPGNYSYTAVKEGYESIQGEVNVKRFSTEKQSLNFIMLNSLERDLPLFQQRYPGYRVGQRYEGPGGVSVARIQKKNDSNDTKLLLVKKDSSQLTVIAEGVDYFTPDQITGLSSEISTWLIQENFIADSTFSQEVD